MLFRVFHNTYRKTAFILLLFCAAAYLPVASYGSGIESLNYNVDAFARNPKLRGADKLLEEFERGATSVQVIVMLKNSRRETHRNELKINAKRQQVRKEIRDHLDDVMVDLPEKGFSIQKRFSYMAGFGAEVSADALTQLLQMPAVESVEPNRVLKAHLAQGISLINAMTVRDVYRGQGIGVAVCDTGIDYTHDRLGNGGFPNDKVIGGYDFGGSYAHPIFHDSDPMDQNGHGTACAGIIAGDDDPAGDYIGGVAPGAKLYALKISYGSTGEAFESDMIEAWEWCFTHQNDILSAPIMVISTSFGFGKFDTECAGYSPAMTQSAENAVNAGITIFVSSGNDGYCDSLAWPACISSVVSVGAVFDANIGGVGFCVDEESCALNRESYPSCSSGYVAWAYTTQSDQVAPYSNVASFLDMLAPAHRTKTTTTGGGFIDDFGGTSAACPYAAGVAACMQSAAKSVTGFYLSPAEIKTKMIGSGDLNTYAGITKPRINLGNTDIDDDGMTSGWEMTYFGNLSHGENDDGDIDGLSNIDEFTHQTYPNDPDSDDDTYNDGQEVAAGTDPLNPDSHPISVVALSGPYLFFIFAGMLFIGMAVKRCRC